MDFRYGTPASSCLVGKTIDRHGNVCGYQASVDTGASQHDRLYCYFRLGCDVVVSAQCRVAAAVDFCGGSVVSSVLVTIYTGKGRWSNDICATTDGGNDYMCWDDELHMSIPNMLDAFERCEGDLDSEEDITKYALYSLGCALMCQARESERNALMACDVSEDGGYDEKPGFIYEMLSLMEGVREVRPCLYWRPSVKAEDTRDSGRRAATMGSKAEFPLDGELHVTSFHNRNSGNEVVSLTFVGAHGVFDYEPEEYYNGDDCCDCGS